MNIWTRLGISVALAALFYITMAESLQSTLLYQVHKWRICAGLLVAGAVLFFAGSWLNRRRNRRYQTQQAALPEQDRDADPRQAEPFLLFNMAYWGIVTVLFSVITVFIVPSHHKPEKQKPQVAARATPPPPTNVPSFKFQGMTLRGANPSALINGRTYFIGDLVGEAKVLAIETNQAVLEWRGTKVVLPAPQ